MQIRTVFADVREFDKKAVFEENLSKLPAWRAEKIKAMRQPKKKLESLCAWLLFWRVAGELGISLRQVELGENGRPCIAGRDDLDFSLAHSGNLAACSVAVADRRSEEPVKVGVDLERRGERDFLTVARRFFTPEECDKLAGQRDGEAQKDLFYRYWTLKESCLKADGAGLLRGLDALKLSLPETIGRAEGTAFGLDWYFREYRVKEASAEKGREENYAMAVCGNVSGFCDTLSRVTFP